jgi:hypothetical protein
MFKQLIAAAALFASGIASASTDVEAILKKADSFRLLENSAQVESLVQTYKGGQLDKEKRYQVLIKPHGKSLVLFRSPGEQGQKVLMVGDDFWMIMPSSARPIRITPLQKLLGDASTGDIANMTWSGDYTGTLGQEVEINGIPCLTLDLLANRKSLSYQRIVLHVAKKDHRPVHADLFAQSNRKLKQARFDLEVRDGRTMVSKMTLIDEVQTNRETVVTTLSSKPRELGAEIFNPMYLTRNDVK